MIAFKLCMNDLLGKIRLFSSLNVPVCKHLLQIVLYKAYRLICYG